MQDNSNRNTIIFVVSAMALLLAYQFLVMGPRTKAREAELALNPPAASAQVQAQNLTKAPPTAAETLVSRQTAAAASPRVRIETPALSGSVSLRGARLDDLYLKQYRETVAKNAPPVELLRPEGAKHAQFAEFGWAGANVPGLPTAATIWTQTAGSTLAPGAPVTLQTTNGAGLTFTRQISVDDRFMFTISDTVANTGAGAVTLAPYGSVQRQGVPSDIGTNSIVHEGAVGWLGEELRLIKFKKWAKDGGSTIATTGGWAGITDKYWLAALIPAQNEAVQSQFRVTKAGGVDIFEANYVGSARTINPGRQITETQRFFGGAKTVPVLKAYETTLGVPRFDQAVDWGMFWFFTRPLFQFLEFINSHVGNFGIAILLLTVAVKVVFFPLANKSYESITKMKKVQPEIEALRTKYKDDPTKQQTELMALYQKEKINPITGCLPMLLQIPVFYALYKVLTVTIEMRHAHFFGWIQDLSARDPSTIWTLFGLIPWNPATTPMIGGLLDGSLHIGILALAYGVTMWLTTAMNPPVGDPIQQKIFQFMPIIFTFIMAPFAVGLLIYWTWSNVLTIGQQYIIMRRFKVDNPIDDLIARFSGKPKAQE
ncbi:MAG: membrane protein insertase YidC [Phenylobacterium sp.]|uniref:membrane protein insertase YidC n=1 Tax=Phenylobacterium sp. TaxID=1871053 RepID=UPI002727C0C2|nr:membrane protein insertase YidC [Phenylobacterium sp.]MDO8912928.1 membrane protein insertase YidC [Phenylobacterium sp.]MDP2012574.1 membrane protein insertase YidC [Phenylobacterium sp.]MDP3102081.1 membrane protein insertase YidC [Phenylobacterium sp.]MDP3631789.1 membrane protein insertase YidC [Phenylobacterium sp.]MDP3870990.1 membrane protein insertase YidC [Phenylobacterium sp.]